MPPQTYLTQGRSVTNSAPLPEKPTEHRLSPGATWRLGLSTQALRHLRACWRSWKIDLGLCAEDTWRHVSLDETSPCRHRRGRNPPWGVGEPVNAVELEDGGRRLNCFSICSALRRRALEHDGDHRGLRSARRATGIGSARATKSETRSEP